MTCIAGDSMFNDVKCRSFMLLVSTWSESGLSAAPLPLSPRNPEFRINNLALVPRSDGL